MRLPETKEIEPRFYQIEAYNKIGEAIRNYTGPVFIDASVGAGKTIIMGMVNARAQEIGHTTLTLARRGELVEQNAKTFWACGFKNSIYSSSVGIKSTHYNNIVGSEGTIARALNNELKNYAFDFLLIDECHEVDYENEDGQYLKIIRELQRRNPKLRIIGFTGSPYRGTESITGDFWKKCIYRITTDFLVSVGFLTPTIFGFGHDEIKYDLSEFKASKDEGDYTRQELLAMQRKLTKDATATQRIMAEVIDLTVHRNAVMITGAGKKHLEQIAECLPPDSYVIITESTGSKARREALKLVSEGKIKYILQVGCLTTGYDEPLIDTSVLMRKIGSLTLLTQLLGRGMRLLKPHHIEAGIQKENHLVLDYTETMMEMSGLYNSPLIDSAEKERAASSKNEDMIICPACHTSNSARARRCIHRPEDADRFPRPEINGIKNYSLDGRCEFFWNSKPCPECNTNNDLTARECRKCEYILIDPNRNLLGKHYTDNDWQAVKKMYFNCTKDKSALLVFYELENGETVKEMFWPQGKAWQKAAFKNNFVKKHLHISWHQKLHGKKPPELAKMGAVFDVPTHITHRKNEQGWDIIHRKRFKSGREEGLNNAG